MSLHAFDTLKYATDLEKGGFDSKQAKVLASAHAEVLSELLQEKLATKEDLLHLKSEIKEDLQKLSTKQELLNTKLELKEEIKDLEERITYKLTIRLGRMIIGSFIATVTTLAFLMDWMLKGVH